MKRDRKPNTKRHKLIRQNEGDFFTEMPPPPERLKRREKELWAELGAVAIKRCCISEIHLHLFEGLVFLTYQYEQLIKEVLINSKTAKDGSNIYPNNLLQALRESEKVLCNCYSGFQLEFKPIELP